MLAYKAGMAADDTLRGAEQLLNDWLDLPLDAHEAYRKQATLAFQARFSIQRAADSLVDVLAEAIKNNRPHVG